MAIVQAEHIIDAFDSLGGNPQTAIDSASEFSTTSGWIHWQTAQVATVGAAAMMIPGVHLAGIAADLAVLFHKMAYCAWGVGAIMGAPINPKEDFTIILGLWANAIVEEDIPDLISSMGGITLIIGMATFAPKTTEKGIAKLLTKGVSKLTAKASGKIVSKGTAKGLGKIAGKLLSKYSAKIAAKMTAKISAKGLAGFVPFLGPMIGGGINIWFLEKIGYEAEIYYEKKLKLINNL